MAAAGPVEVRLHQIVQGIGVQVLAAAGVIAIEQVAVANIAVAIDLLQLDPRLGVAEVLPRAPDVVESVLELIANHLLGAFEFVVVGFAVEKVVADVAAIAAIEAAFGWYATVVAAIRVLLQIGLKGQGGIVAQVDGQAGRQGVTLFFHMVELGVAVLRQTHQAIGDAPLLVQRTAEIEAGAMLAEIAQGGLDLMIGLVQRLLAGQGHQTARQAAAIEHRRRPLHHVNALGEIGTTCSELKVPLSPMVLRPSRKTLSTLLSAKPRITT